MSFYDLVRARSLHHGRPGGFLLDIGFRPNCRPHRPLVDAGGSRAAGAQWQGYPEPVDGKSLLPLLRAEEPGRDSRSASSF